MDRISTIYRMEHWLQSSLERNSPNATWMGKDYFFR